MNICKCGCNLECKKLWMRGHNSRDRVHSEETKQKMSESLIRKNLGRVLSEETRKKMRENSIGKNLGVARSEETRKKMSEAKIGVAKSEESRRKMSESSIGKNLGQIRSEETKKKISESSKGRAKSEETRKKMSEGNKGKIHSEETKRKMKGHKPANPYGVSKWIPYMECDLSISKMPTYEYHVRVYLDSIGESYIWCAKGNYPEHIMRLSNGTAYYPDFYLPNHKVYLDPKGFWQNLEKKALIEAEYPNQCYHFLGDTYLQQIKDFIQEKYTVIV